MKVYARNVPATRHVHAATRAGSGFESWKGSPDERIGPPTVVGRGRMVRRLILVMVIAFAGTWAWLDGERLREVAPSLASAALQRMSAAISSAMSGGPPPAVVRRDGDLLLETADNATAATPTASVDGEPADTSAGLRDPSQAAPTMDDQPRSGGEGRKAPASTPQQVGTAYAEPKATGGDAYQRRAEAAGLHPDLSRVLLARLLPADYQNAAVAVEMAVAQTPDDGVLVWPKQRKPDQALFSVHFVPGAGADCRRYVVTVTTKDNWSTTALPMERCGVPRVRPAARG